MTAVEWLLQQMDLETISKYDKQLVKAKELEKQQIKNAWKSGDTNGRIGILKTKEQYYNETFGDVE